MSEGLAVIDANIIIKAILPNPDRERCQSVLAQLQNVTLVVPALCFYEVTSTLAKAVHFKQLTEEESKAALHQVMELYVEIIPPDETQSLLALDWTLKMNRGSAYDSFYLAIADGLGAPFWTADRHLVNALQDQRPAWLHWIGEIN